MRTRYRAVWALTAAVLAASIGIQQAGAHVPPHAKRFSDMTLRRVIAYQRAVIHHDTLVIEAWRRSRSAGRNERVAARHGRFKDGFPYAVYWHVKQRQWTRRELRLSLRRLHEARARAREAYARAHPAFGREAVAAISSCLVTLIDREDPAWDVHKWNEDGSGAYGLPQALPGGKMSTAGSDWRDNPWTQIRWMVGYVNGRYGGPCQALAHSYAVGWY